MTSISLRTVCLDCEDAHAMAAFYSKLLGWEPTFTEPDWVLVRNPDGGVGLSFQAEPKFVRPVWPETAAAQQKMIHLDVMVDDLEAAVAVAIEAGGRLHDHQPREDLRIVLDPSGHPLCLFTD